MDKSTDGTAMEVDHDGVQAQILESGTHDAQGQSSTDHSSVLFPIPDGSLERDGSQDHEPSQQDKPQISHSMQGLHLDSERQNSDPCESVPAAGENHGHQYDEAESDQSAAPGHSESPLIPHERDSPPWTNGQPSPPKRKHEGDEANQRKRLEPGDRTVRESTSQAAFTSLGSLDSFMETRGVKLQAVGRSPYFNTKDQDDGEQKESENSVKEETPEEPTDFKASQQVPQCHSIGQDPPILFLATALLKTHSRVVKSLEDMEAAPTLVFRDYNDTPGTKASPVKTPTKTNQAKASPAKTKPPGAVEADIIVSPSTGIILTTSQAITQVHLPGHKASPDVEGIAGINSPLRERVFRAARRYEQLYIFISQFMESKKLSNKSQGPTIDKRTSSALTSLTAFCNSARIYSTITPLLISSAPEVMAEWIMSLADKHAFTVTRPSSPSQFTPVNKRGIEALYTVASMESESNWELFLRQAGMNPFAALTTLGIMRKHEKEHLARPDSKNEYVFPVSNRRKKIRCLSKFMEMRPEQRRELVGEAIGHRVLKRVEDMIEQDWHCDWALDFEDEE